MAAAYAALLSLTHLMVNIQKYGQHLISIDKIQIQSLLQELSSLQDFLAVNNFHTGSEELETFESQIRDAAYAAEDIIESCIVRRIRNGSTGTLPSQFLHIVMERMAIIKKMMEIKDRRMRTQPPVDSLHVASPSRRAPSSDHNKKMVGCEDELIQILERLTGEGSSRQVVPIVGMGGIGKTTLATNAYVHPLTKEYFDVRAWVTVSQEYSIRDIIFSLLNEMGLGHDKRNQANISEDELGEQLYKKLCGMRYLIVIDDIWSIEAWEKVRMFLPSNHSGSRIVVTTRLSNVANQFGSSVVEMGFLDEDKSWSLFCTTVFGQEGCPHIELEETGKKIVRNCKGLPLSIIVIGGLLAKSGKTQEFWELVVRDVNSVINSEDDGHCLKLLRLSYVHLPIHLKPCFLYFGVFPEDTMIDVSRLVSLWVAEGFLKLIEAKSLEEVAEQYLGDLVDRNLVLVGKTGSRGNIKALKIHDLLRELCLREAENENFLYRTKKLHNLDINPPHINDQRCLVIREGNLDENELLQSASSARSLISYNQENLSSYCNSFKLLRVLNVIRSFWGTEEMRLLFRDLVPLVNSRYLAVNVDWSSDANNFPSIHKFWNLQTLIVSGSPYGGSLVLPSEIWMMRQLRHLKIYDSFYLPDPPPVTARHTHSDREYDNFVVLENLQTLVKVESFKCSEDIVKRVPNIKILGIIISNRALEEYGGPSSPYCLNNLCYLTKLESLNCYFSPRITPNASSTLRQHNLLAFPRSLKKLTLHSGKLSWEDMSPMVGSLPHLEVLKLSANAFTGHVWKPVEGEFLHLKVLRMRSMDLEYWVADATHFPCLQQLVLEDVHHLVEIPLGFADISTLRSITLYLCKDSTMVSAKRILDELESLGNEDLQVQAWCPAERQKELEHLAGGNFNLFAD